MSVLRRIFVEIFVLFIAVLALCCGEFLSGGVSSCPPNTIPYAITVDAIGHPEILCETPECYMPSYRPRQEAPHKKKQQQYHQRGQQLRDEEYGSNSSSGSEPSDDSRNDRSSGQFYSGNNPLRWRARRQINDDDSGHASGSEKAAMLFNFHKRASRQVPYDDFKVTCNSQLTETACTAPSLWTGGVAEWNNGTHISLQMRCCRVPALPHISHELKTVWLRAGQTFRGGIVREDADNGANGNGKVIGFDLLKEIRKSVSENNEVRYSVKVFRMECAEDNSKSNAELFYEKNRETKVMTDRMRPSAAMLRIAMSKRKSSSSSAGATVATSETATKPGAATYLQQMKMASVSAQLPKSQQKQQQKNQGRHQRLPLSVDRRRHPSFKSEKSAEHSAEKQYSHKPTRGRAAELLAIKRGRLAHRSKQPLNVPIIDSSNGDYYDLSEEAVAALQRSAQRKNNNKKRKPQPHGSSSSSSTSDEGERGLWPVRLAPTSSIAQHSRLYSAGDSFDPDGLQTVVEESPRPGDFSAGGVPIEQPQSTIDVQPLPSEQQLQNVEVAELEQTGVTPLSNNPSPAVQDGYQTLNSYLPPPPTQLLSTGGGASGSNGGGGTYTNAAYAPQPSQYAVDTIQQTCPTTCAQPEPYCVPTPSQPCCCSAGGGADLNGALSSLQCFSGDMLVMTRDDGLKRVDQLRVGDYVLSVDQSLIMYSRVMMFLHRKPYEPAAYRRVEMADGRVLKLTAFHLIYAFECGSDSPKTQTIRLVQARRLRVGQCVYTIGGTSPSSATMHAGDYSLRASQITAITTVKEVGIYAPLTASGNIVVNEVLASCHSNVAAQTLQQTFFIAWRSAKRFADGAHAVQHHVYHAAQRLAFVVAECAKTLLPTFWRVNEMRIALFSDHANKSSPSYCQKSKTIWPANNVSLDDEAALYCGTSAPTCTLLPSSAADEAEDAIFGTEAETVETLMDNFKKKNDSIGAKSAATDYHSVMEKRTKSDYNSAEEMDGEIPYGVEFLLDALDAIVPLSAYD